MAAVVADHDLIVNLAGESGAVRSMEAPIDDLDGNCRANFVVLEAIRRHTARREAGVRRLAPAIRPARRRCR